MAVGGAIVNSVVIYATRSGNTRQVATAIADELRTHGEVHVLSAEEAQAALPGQVDLLVVGGPTEGHGATEPIVRFLDRLGPQMLDGVAVAAFDTRLRWPRVLSGSAAAIIARRLEAAGGRVVVPAESFLVSRKPELEPGELDRAPSWAAAVAAAVGPLPVPA
jgi:flavodoxin